MVFDPCREKVNQVVINAAIEFRKLKGLPEEKNITVLYNEMAPLLGIAPQQMSSKDVDHLPSPAETKDKDGNFTIPNKPCPKCGKITFLNSICPACKDFEGGKYKSGYKCDERNGGCGFIDDKTDERFSQRLKRMGIEIPEGMKEDLGIKTITDQGLK